MQTLDQSAVPRFKLLPCRIGDGVDVISDIRHFTYGDAHLFIAWRDETVLIFETPGPELNHLEYNYKLHDPLLLDAPMENVIRIGDSIRILDKEGCFYELKESLQAVPSNSMYEEDMFSDGESTMEKQYKFVKNLKLHKVVRLISLKEGLVLIKKQAKGNVYVMNFYTNNLVKKFSIHLPNFIAKDEADCFLASSALRLEPKLRRLLLKDSPLGEVDVLFAGWDCNVYALAVNFSSTSAPVPKLVYHSDHLITTILMLEGTVAWECSVVGVVLSVGCVVCLSAREQVDSLCYTTLYLPTDTFRVLCSTQDCIVCGDGRHLWLCRLKPHPYVDLRAGVLPVRSVNAVAVITGTRAILAVTMYGDMYWLSSNCLGEDVEDKTGVGISTYGRGTNTTADVLQAIHEGSSRVQELSEQIAVEDRLIAGLNLATRIDILKKYFELKVTVDCMESLLVQPSPVVNLWSANTKGFYQINISIRNLTYQQFHAPAWLLAVSMKTAGETCTRLVSLESGLSEHHPVQLTLPLAVPSPGGGSVEVACDLVSRMLRPGKPWISITVGSVVLDVSYFFELRPDLFPSRLLMRKDHSATVREDLVSMACCNNLSLQVELNHLRLLRKEELKIILKFHKPVEARSLWSVLLGQCLHRLPADVQTQYACGSGVDGSKVPRTLVVHAGSQKVAVSLDSSRTMATLTSCDVRLLHAIRTLVASRLVTLKKSGMVHVATDLFRKADHILPVLEEVDIVQMRKALQDWRRHSSRLLPI